VPESDQLPASFPLLHSFTLWAITDPNVVNPSILAGVPFKPVWVSVTKKYLSAVQAWHITQGWPPPLSKEDHDCINWSLHGLKNLQASCKHPLQPPVTLNMLQALQSTLKLNDPFKACIWAMAACAFWEMMCFGEVSVPSHNAFDSKKHLMHQDTHFSYDLDKRLYVCLDLPSAKTAKSREIQSVFMVPQEGLCPLEALQNLAKIVPARQSDPLFSWQDRQGNVHPMVKTMAINHINLVLKSWGWGNNLWALIQNWQSIILLVSESRSWDCLHCRALVLTCLWSLHTCLWTGRIMTPQRFNE